MIIKKLAVPFINEKLLSQAAHCYIASGAVSEQGFDFVVSRLSLKCKVEIVTGLQVPTEPKVLRRIFKHFPDRVQLRIYTRNLFHPNVYIFDLPYRKAVAFIGSGTFTPGGLKDHEEIFYKITDAKEIESLKSWFTGYFEFSEPLTESIIDEYEWVYPSMKQREIVSRQESSDLLDLTTRGFNWDNIRFKNQYFKKEDFLAFANNKASLNTAEIQNERLQVKNKLLQLHESIKGHLSALKLYEDYDSRHVISSLDPTDHPDRKLRSIWIAYGRSERELNEYYPQARHGDFMRLLLILRQKEVGIWLMPGTENAGRQDREYFSQHMVEPGYRIKFFELLTGLNPDPANKANHREGYWIQVSGEKRSVSTFQNEEALWEFTRYDDWKYYTFTIGKNYSPADPQVNTENLTSTISGELDKLILLYNHMKHQ